MKALRKIKLGYGKTYNPGEEVSEADIKQYPHITKYCDGKAESKTSSKAGA